MGRYGWEGKMCKTLVADTDDRRSGWGSWRTIISIHDGYRTGRWRHAVDRALVRQLYRAPGSRILLKDGQHAKADMGPCSACSHVYPCRQAAGGLIRHG